MSRSILCVPCLLLTWSQSGSRPQSAGEPSKGPCATSLAHRSPGARVELTVAGRARTRSAPTAPATTDSTSVPPASHRSGGDARGAGAGERRRHRRRSRRCRSTSRSATSSPAESVSVAGVAPGATLDTPAAAASRLGLTARETPATVSVMTFAEAQTRGLAPAPRRSPGSLASPPPTCRRPSRRRCAASPARRSPRSTTAPAARRRRW